MRIAIAAALLIAAAIAQEPTRSVWDGVYTQEQADRGRPLYNEHCASCHADTLMGGEMSPPLVGGEFMSNWNGLTLGDLFERIRTTMPQSKPGKLSREVNADITAYILSVNKFPAGKTELPHSAEFLKDIRIDSEKKQH
ncbi:MAG TPA: cytochrome c [Bryobacteraceae bacterium]|jgi:mono/diheme cytochrome c family protein|nr:cytochrome c [Bryobacteraceae bacterium]